MSCQSAPGSRLPICPQSLPPPPIFFTPCLSCSQSCTVKLLTCSADPVLSC
ncbi:unnamed protein product [Staurois parvus]|uniref:Uncharacterized protein n=1 Tax=Staurois parvus TaxID=386267 RepID=A0ABN9FC11_9NEOB|nr:unnamed protein product [Staurois parvus]